MKKNILRQKYDQKHARYWGFPGSAVITNLPSSAGDAGLSPDQGTRIPCASGQPSLSTAITEPASLESVLHKPQLEKTHALQ